MSLFPAYGAEGKENAMEYEVSLAEISNASPSVEAQLLASEDDEEVKVEAAAPSSPRREESFYQDRRWDPGNLRVSTLYYPGRPQYERRKRVTGEPDAARRARRYWQAVDLTRGVPGDEAGEVAQRSAAYRDMLAQRPDHDQLWLTYIDFLERCGAEGAALAAAEQARAAAGGSTRVRAALHRLRAALPPARRRHLLRADVQASSAERPALRLEAWARLLGEEARRGDLSQLERTAGEALSALRSYAPAYPHVLYLYGGALRAAGLWERLVLLVELTLAVNLAPHGLPSPDLPPDERGLQRAEDELLASGLPLSEVWVRVERARAAAHWRPATLPSDDPQRTPLPADVADLVQPARGAHAQLLLAVQALRLAKVPLLPGAQYVSVALQPALGAGDAAQWSCGEALLMLVRAARRLPPAHPARPHTPALARHALAATLDPPHYLTHEHGYEEWVRVLWEAALGAVCGSSREALLCWRLRWLHARALLEEAGGARRLRGEARTALKRWAEGSPLAYAQFARLELVVAGREAARRVALQAARAALQDAALPAAHRLYVARVLGELAPHAALWATSCAALGRALPAAQVLEGAPPAALLQDALLACERECTSIEARLCAGGGGDEEEHEGGEGESVRVLSPHGGEWCSARVRLSSPAQRAHLVQHVQQHAASGAQHGEAARYWEQAACALVTTQQHMVTCARQLATLYPHNALLALACSGAPLWAGGAGMEAAGAAPRTLVGAVARVIPALLRAVPSWRPEDAARLAKGCARALRDDEVAGGALLHALRLEAEARAPRPRPQAALLSALDALPNNKCVYVRGASCVCAQSAALCDAVLERGLRLHTLRDELTIN